MAGNNGLSRKTNLQGDIAKKEAVNVNCNYKIGDNHRPLASSSAAHDNPGGKLGAKSLPGGWKKGKK